MFDIDNFTLIFTLIRHVLLLINVYDVICNINPTKRYMYTLCNSSKWHMFTILKLLLFVTSNVRNNKIIKNTISS